MIQKIDIKDASIAEEVRKQMNVATPDNKGLMEANSVRYVKSSGIMVEEKNSCIKLYSATRTTAISAIVSHGRVEGVSPGSFILSFSMTAGGNFSKALKGLLGSNPAKFYYYQNGSSVSIYIVTGYDHSVTNVVPLIETGGYSYHLTRDTLPDGAVEIIPE